MPDNKKLEPFASIDKVNKRLFGTVDPVIMLKRYKRCIVFDEKSGCFLLKTSSIVNNKHATDKMFQYIRFWHKQCPEFRTVRKTEVTAEKLAGKPHIASCLIDITLW